MTPAFAILDAQQTPLGLLSLRRRFDARLQAEVYEIKLGDEFLMTSHFTASEVALAEIALADPAGEGLEVAVGGLGLGYTAAAALRDSRVAALLVVERLAPVIAWHERGLLPLGRALAEDERCRFVEGDFFALAAAEGFDPARPGRRFDAVLLDVDHAPDKLLDPSHAALYEPDGLRRLARHLKPGGRFGLWSNDPPDPAFVARLQAVFGTARGEVVRFDNPLTGGEELQGLYLARNAGA